MLNKEIFRQYDVRGIYPDSLNEEAARTIANTFAARFTSDDKRAVIAVGMDVRKSSPSLYDSCVEGILDAGCDVILLGYCPSPLTYFASEHFNADGYLMITGSHNPPEYNGIKLSAARTVYHSEAILSLRTEACENGYIKADTKGSAKEADINSIYCDWCAEHFAETKRLIDKSPTPPKVVIDCGNGVAGTIAPEIFSRLGCEVVELFCTPDGSYPNHHPDPTIEENLSDAKNAVLSNSADFAAAYDGDADRLGIIDSDGKAIWGDELLGIFADEMVRCGEKPLVIADVKASQNLFGLLEKIGADYIMWKSGHSMIKSKMWETNAVLGGEMSAHIFFSDRYFGYDDAIYASLRFLEAFVSRKAAGVMSRTSDFLKIYPETFNTPEIRIDFPDDKKFQAAEKFSEKLKEKESIERLGIKNIIDIDGIRVEFEHGWGLLRASNTQPVISMRFEASSKELLDKYRSLMQTEFEIITGKL